MKKIILIFIIILLIPSIFALVEPKIYYKLNLNSKNGSISINSIDIEFYNKDIQNNFGFYSLKIFDSDKNIIKTINFSINNKGIAESVDENGYLNKSHGVELKNLDFEIYVPYYENAKEIIIYDYKNNELLSEDISMYSKSDESNPFLGKNVKNKTLNEDKLQEESKNNKNYSSYLWILGIAIIIIFIIFFIIKTNRR